MSILLDEVEKRINTLKQIINEKEKSLVQVPEGSVHIFNSPNRTQYYLKDNGIRRYMQECEKQEVKKLCQKDYDQKVLRSALRELKLLERLHKDYEKNSCEAVYEKLNIARKKFVHPVILPDEEYIKEWESIPYEKKGFRDDAPEFYTEKGERVRSKTEILIANALYRHNIPYRYEAPLELGNYGIVHPDFTILNVRFRMEIYWEHMGMLDDEDYRRYALEKILAYEKCDIFPGDKLILTHETNKSPVNSRILEKIILQYLK